MLAARARSVRGPYRDWLRARIVLAAAAGQNNAAIAVEMGVCADTVRKWRKRNLGFPAPIAVLRGASVFDWREVEAWAKRTGRP